MNQVIRKTWYFTGKADPDNIQRLLDMGIELNIVDNYDGLAFPVTGSMTTEYYRSRPIELQLITSSPEQETWMVLLLGENVKLFSTLYDIEYKY